MDYRFLAETLALKPPLFRAMLDFNRDMAASPPEELSRLGTPVATLWNDPAFRRAWPSRKSGGQGYWNFSEDSQRLVLLPSDTVTRLCLFFSAAVHAEEIARVIAREQVLELREVLGADIVSYALKRGRYQIRGLRAILLVPPSFGTLPQRLEALAIAAPRLISEEWPDELRHLALSRHLLGEDSTIKDMFMPPLEREQRRALWFTMKKILLREVAPQWAPCFD